MLHGTPLPKKLDCRSDACTRTRHARHRKRGAAIVELCLSLPLLFLIVFGSIEACNCIYLQQCLTEAAYEGAVAGIKMTATEQDVTDRMDAMLGARGIDGATYDIVGPSNATFDNIGKGDTFSVTVTVTRSSIMQIINEYNEMSATRVAIKQ